MIGDTHKPGDLPADAVAEVAGACRIAEALERTAKRRIEILSYYPPTSDAVRWTWRCSCSSESMSFDSPEAASANAERHVCPDPRDFRKSGLGDLADPLARRCQAAAVILSDLAESLRGMGDRERMVEADEDDGLVTAGAEMGIDLSRYPDAEFKPKVCECGERLYMFCGVGGYCCKPEPRDALAVDCPICQAPREEACESVDGSPHFCRVARATMGECAA